MDKNLRISLMTLTATLLLLAGLERPVSAQYVISARAGLVNYTTGPVSYASSDHQDWREVPSSLQLDEGDRIKTDAWGKAEILLLPGSFLRIAGGAEMRMVSTVLAATTVELLSGSAIVEAGQFPDASEITVQTPYSRVRIAKAGLYRIDLAPEAMTLTVRHGVAYFSQPDGSFKKVKKNQTVLVTESSHHIAKFDPDDSDEFDLWSADRAELLLAANHSFLRRTALWQWPSLFWNAWIYDPFFGCYTFFPWQSAFWSPYGYGYYYPWYSGGGSLAGGGGGFIPYDRAASPRSDNPLPGVPSKPGVIKARQEDRVGTHTRPWSRTSPSSSYGGSQRGGHLGSSPGAPAVAPRLSGSGRQSGSTPTGGGGKVGKH
jgi:hypothetical protein